MSSPSSYNFGQECIWSYESTYFWVRVRYEIDIILHVESSVKAFYEIAGNLQGSITNSSSQIDPCGDNFGPRDIKK